MKEVGYYNGTIGPLAEMTVPIFDRALYFGDGIYEATCVANGVVFALDDHLDRMYNSLRLMEIPFKMTRDEIKAELHKVIAAAEPAPCQFLYWQITRGNSSTASYDREIIRYLFQYFLSNRHRRTSQFN